MALSRALIVVALTATMFSTISMAKEFIVGDEVGWTTGFDYQSWTANKVFRVGDILTFKYPTGQDNVFKVNGTDFRNCKVPAGSQGWNSGQDSVVLETPVGRKWFVSGVANHCALGQKLFITVLPQTEFPSPSPSPSVSVLPITVTPSAAPWAPWASPSPSPAYSGGWVPRKLISIFQN